MFMFVSTLVFIFTIRLRFPSKVSIATILKRRYGNLGLSTFRDVEKLDFNQTQENEMRHQLPAKLHRQQTRSCFCSISAL